MVWQAASLGPNGCKRHVIHRGIGVFTTRKKSARSDLGGGFPKRSQNDAASTMRSDTSIKASEINDFACFYQCLRAHRGIRSNQWTRVVAPRVGMVAPMVSMVAPRSFRFLSFRFQLSFALVSIGAAPSGSEWLRNGLERQQPVLVQIAL